MPLTLSALYGALLAPFLLVGLSSLVLPGAQPHPVAQIVALLLGMAAFPVLIPTFRNWSSLRLPPPR
ncbi:MAG: hypothetical protein ABIO70_17945 [Pseudomonadota bacterium]